MKWLARVKNTTRPETDATKPTKPGFVGFVAPIPACVGKNKGESAAGNQGFVGFVAPVLAPFQKNEAAPAITTGANFTAPDRWAWPHTEAANSAEISAMATRLERFARLGLAIVESERLADRLLIRDRDPDDDRRLCLECQHCHYGRCSNNEAAGLRAPELGPDYALSLKRCNGFAAGNGTLAPVTVTQLAPGTQHGHPLTPQHQAEAQEYHRHHFTCPTCQAAGRGYGDRCSDGMALWAQYQGTQAG